MTRPIAISLSPNAERDDILLAIRQLFNIFSWHDYSRVQVLEEKFSTLFGNHFKAFATNSGRSALYIILESLAIQAGDEVIIQAGTCVVVPNVIRYLGAKPIYVDVDATFNIDSDDLVKKITDRTRVLLVQHSFGVPADMHRLVKICKKYSLVVVEDCAISLGAKLDTKLVGTYGDAAFFSFGRDKIVSSVFGGMILTRRPDLLNRIRTNIQALKAPSDLWSGKQLLHPILFSLVLSTYAWGIGKITLGKTLLFLSQKLGILTKAVYKEEKTGGRPSFIPGKMHPVLAVLALNQLAKLTRFNNIRRSMVKIYEAEMATSSLIKPSGRTSGAVWVRFPILVDKPKSLLRYAQRKGLVLGNWYDKIVMPTHTSYLADYIKGSCPKAERISTQIVNLPTYPLMTPADAKTVINVVKLWQNTQQK